MLGKRGFKTVARLDFSFCGNEVWALAFFLDGNEHSLSIAPPSRATRTEPPSAAATRQGETRGLEDHPPHLMRSLCAGDAIDPP